MNKKDIFWKLGYLVVTACVFLLDQTTKSWASRKLRFSGDVEVIPDFFNFAYAENTGVAFSLFNSHGDTGRMVLSGLAFLAATLVLYFFWRTPRSDDRMLGALSLLLAGILGNVIDRVRLGYVVDFIDFQIGNWHYPTFNVADMAICTGAGLLILDMFLTGRREKREESVSENPIEEEQAE